MPQDTQTTGTPPVPVTTPETPLPAPQLSATQVPVIDPTTNQPFDLRNIDVATADRLRPLLPAEYQEEARQVEALVVQFQSFSMMNVPQGFSFEHEIPRLVEAMRRGVTDFSNDPNLQWAYEHLRDLPGVREAIAAGRDAQAIGEGVANQSDGYSRGSQALSRLGHVFDVMYSSTLGGEHITPEQARAFGTAYAAATYKAVQGNANRPTVDTNATFLDTAFSWIQWPCSLAIHWLPRDLFGTGIDLPHLLLQVTDAASAMIHGQWDWSNWSHSWEAAGQEATHTLATETQAPSREEFEHRNTTERVRREQADIQIAAHPDATTTIVAAGSVAGIRHTADLGRLVMTGGVIRDQQGRIFTAKYADGRLVTEPVNGPDGKQLTLGDEYAQASQGLFPQSWSQLPSYLLGVGSSVLSYAIPGYAGVRATQGFYEGAWRQPATRAAPLEARAASLTTRAANIEAGHPSFWDKMRGTTPESLRTQAAAITERAAPLRAAADTRLAATGGEAFAAASSTPTRFSWISPRSWGRGIGEVTDRVVSGTLNIAGAGIRKIGWAPMLEAGAEFLAKYGIEIGAHATPLVGAVVSVGDGVIDTGGGLISGDNRQTIRGGVKLGTVATGAGIGFCVGGPVGALVGAGVGGIVSIFSGMGSDAVYDHYHPEEVATRDRRENGDQPPARDSGLDQANRDAAARAEAARRQADAQHRGQPITFASVTSVTPPQGVPLPPQGGLLSGIVFGAVS